MTKLDSKGREVPEDDHLYFLKLGDGPYRHVSKSEWVSAERSAGFQPKGEDRGQPATGGFGGSAGVDGSIFSVEHGSVEAYEEFNPALAAAIREALGARQDTARYVAVVNVTADVCPDGYVDVEVREARETRDDADASEPTLEPSGRRVLYIETTQPVGYRHGALPMAERALQSNGWWLTDEWRHNSTSSYAEVTR
jgi:hypothetical protein